MTTRTDAGFSLIEVIVSLAIIAFGLAAFSQTLGTSFRAAQRIRQHAVALSLAQSHLDSLAADGMLLDGQTTGKYANGTPWRLTVAPLAAPKDAASVSLESVPNPATTAAEALPYWVIVEAFDPQGRPLLKLQTAKIARPRS
jgi:prepilin-type N-terminal cleavage/methylation domain-containing protein